jgi:predicted DsbA family dithiol-disulfide isomerase
VNTTTIGFVLVEIYSDVVCPWCAIGKARFDKAVAMLPAEERESIEVVWRPYQLDPTAPSTPTPVAIGYAKKFGGPDRAAEIIDRVTKTAAEDGITFRMDIAQRANTFDAHRLIGHAFAQGGATLQHQVKQRFLDAYFTQGVDVGSRNELARMAAETGLFEGVEAALAFLQSSALVQRTRDEIADGVDRGVSAVPTFVINNQWSIPGAQDPDVFLKVFARVFAAEKRIDSVVADVDSESCSIDGSDC